MANRKRWIALLLTVLLVLTLLPVSALASTTPATVTVAQAQARLEKLADLFVGRYFTVDQDYCAIGSHSNDCSNCLMSNVVATSWCKNLVGMGTLDSDLFPAQYNYDGTKWSVNGYQCFGFANFAHWYIFARKNTDNLVSTLVGKGPMTHATLKNARPGDVLRTNWLGGHSMVFISCDSTGFQVLDCNYKSNSSQPACEVKIHKVSYSSSYQIAITGVENYNRSNTYAVKYDANGGTGAPAAQTKTHGQALTLSSTAPTRSGYTFKGWATSAGGSAAYQPGGSYTADTAVTLYAVWQQNEVPTGAQIVVSQVTAAAGDTVDVTISLKNNPGITSLKLKVAYDSVLTLTSVVHNSAIGSNFQTSPQLTSPVTLNWYNGASDTTGDWVFVTMTFAVADTAAEGTYAVTATYDPDDVCNIAGDNVSFAVMDGGVTVANYIPGDINNDKKVNNKDLIRLFQYLSDWDVEVQEQALDINNDGKVNNKDLIRLFQYLSDWDVEIH